MFKPPATREIQCAVAAVIAITHGLIVEHQSANKTMAKTIATAMYGAQDVR